MHPASIMQRTAVFEKLVLLRCADMGVYGTLTNNSSRNNAACCVDRGKAEVFTQLQGESNPYYQSENLAS